jgi:sec-independent protein translocase protein TatA
MIEDLFQPVHLKVISGIALFLFGPRRLPELGKGIGEGIGGFRSAMKEPPADTPQKLFQETVLVCAEGQPGRAAHGITPKQECAAAR